MRMKFSDLQLGDDVLRAIVDAGYSTPTPIQAQAIPYILMGRDIVGTAQTGTGKTASFTLPMIDILAAGQAKARMPRSLILEPTRELAAQVAEAFDVYGKYHKLSKCLLIGGESMAEQIKVLERGVDVLIATPGRLLDMFDRGRLLLNDVRILVIDEADRMLDMGFIPDVERIIQLVSRMRQTLLFSATMPPAIRHLADAFLANPKEISVAAPSAPAETVDQALLIVASGDDDGHNANNDKRAALRRLIDTEAPRNALIFCNRKRDVGVLHRSLVRHGYSAAMLHGDLAQSERTEVLERFKRGDVKLLVCSDVAARGLDIEDLSHVFNFDVPTHPEDYVHRIGRTGRAGRAGRALSIALPEDGKYVTLIEELVGKAIARITIDGVTGGELSTGRFKGRRRRGDRSGRPSGWRQGGSRKPAEEKRKTPDENRKAPDVAARPAEPAPPPAPSRQPEARAPGRSQRQPSRPRSRAGEPADRPVVGMGDHVPAFMLREVKLVKKD
jgi:superfamily II DNA/RNA helicase